MDVQLASWSILYGHGQDFRLEARAAACLAGNPSHECANAIARKLALRFRIKPLHLRDESFEWPGCFLLAVAAKAHLYRLVAGAEVKRFLELLGQLCERHVFIDLKMSDERALQIPVVRLHPFRAETP